MKIKIIERLFTWYGKRTVLSVAVIILVLTLVAFFAASGGSEEEVPFEASLPTVEVLGENNSASGQTISVVGTIRAVDEAQVQTEVSGRVVAVQTELGATVQAGSVLLQLENASERASVLQAEGAYEAALATAAQSEVGVEEAAAALASSRNTLRSAEDNIITTYRNAYVAVNTAVVSETDEFFSDPYKTTPGLRIEGQGETATLNAMRVDLNTTLAAWLTKTRNSSTENDLLALLVEAETNTEKTLAYLDLFLEVISDNDPTAAFTEADISAAIAALNAQRSILSGTLTNIDAARTTLNGAEQAVASAEAALTRAEIGATENSEVSAANASVKQALGSLRSAEVALAKTIVRSPITGVVNSFDIKVGDFLSSFSPVATIANNEALEITAFVNTEELPLLQVGMPVAIDGDKAGLLSTIAPGIDSSTGKVEVKIQSTDSALKNGDTVIVAITGIASSSTETTGPLLVPLTAVKFTATAGSVFRVEDNTLVAYPVEVGRVFGEQIQIISGISSTAGVVVDARGLSEGAAVEALSQ